MDHPDIPDSGNTPGSKRKRATESSSPESRRSKRGAPAATMTVSDPEAQAFLENTVSIAQAAQDHVNVEDFSALAQATADHGDAADPASASNTAAAALTIYPTLHPPQTTEETFAAQAAANAHHDETTAYHNSAVSQPDGLPMATPIATPMTTAALQTQPSNGVQEPPRYNTGQNPKPAVGSEEWHKMRKDNHKEVERRRRETINEGINELAKIVPGCEKNKGSILQRAVSFIQQLKENETTNIEKWTLEKLLTEQAIAELSASNDKLKRELDQAYTELDAWKELAQNAGLELPQKEEPGTNS